MTSRIASFDLRRLIRPVIGFLALILLSSSLLFAQKSSAQLKNERKKLEKEIETYMKLLADARDSREKSLNELHLINRQVYLREQMLKGIKNELVQIDEEIVIIGNTITGLEEDLKQIQAQYGRLAVAAYKAMVNKPTSFYILSSGNVKEGYNRMKYFKEFKKAQEAQVKFINRTKAFLDQKRADLEVKKEDKKEVLVIQQKEKEKLAGLKEEQKKLYEELREQEAEYAQTLQTKKDQLVALNKKIEDAIKREIERRAAKPVDPGEDKILPLTNSFKENKGKFPWPLPTPNGVITTKFGRQKLGTSNVDVNINGIDITTTEGQPIRAVFQGTVLEVMSVPGYGKMVIIGHGNYYTVYAHMSDALVQKDQEVTMLQEIGVAKTDSRTGETKVHFQVFYNKTPLNPEEWIVAK